MPGEGRKRGGKIGLGSTLLVSAFVLAFDQCSKYFALKLLERGLSLPVLDGIFHLTLAYNKGAAFGIFKTQTQLLAAIGLAAAAFLVFYIPKLDRKALLSRIGFSSVLGGVLGNLIDRLSYGFVIDFLDFRIWPVFNIADSAITIGAALVIVDLICRKD